MLLAVLTGMAFAAASVNAFQVNVKPSITLRNSAAISRLASDRQRSVASWTMKQNTAEDGKVVDRIFIEFDFPRVPFQTGVDHIHCPEHISQIHKMGAPFFKLIRVLPPKLGESKASITYFCSNLLMKNMCIRMHTDRPDQSNLLFFNSQGKQLYQVCLTVLPTDGLSSHKLTMDISLFTGWLPNMIIAAVLPIFVLINGIEDRLAFDHKHEWHESNSNLSEYRRMVTSKLNPKVPDFASDVCT